MQFLLPWGLAAFASLGAVLFLYFFVFRGKRIPVSALFLWDVGQSLKVEGKKRRRPPLSWPLLLELLAATLLSLIVAMIAVTRVTETKHVVIVLDSSASMNASGSISFRERALAALDELYREVGSDAKASIVRSGLTVELVGGHPLSLSEACTELAGWRPTDPPHSFEPALELARSLARDRDVIALITDRQPSPDALLGGQVIPIGVGEPLENAGWVAASWAEGSSEAFALAKHSGGSAAKKTVQLLGDGREIGRVDLDFTRRDAVPLVITVPDGVATVTAVLPADALENDNTLRLARPPVGAVPVRVLVKHEALRRHVTEAIAAAGAAAVVEDDNALLYFTDSADEAVPEGAFTFDFHITQNAQTYVGPYFNHAFAESAAILRGADFRGVIWPADPEFKPDTGAETLVSIGRIPVAAVEQNRLTLNLRPEGTNLFTQLAWPVLVANVVEMIKARAPGLKRFSYRLGENLSFSRPAAWQGDVTVETPQGASTTFAGPRIYYGRLENDGIYKIKCAGQQVATIDVNLLAETESDLAGCSTFGSVKDVKVALRPAQTVRMFHRELFLGAAILMIVCWAVLERGGR